MTGQASQQSWERATRCAACLGRLLLAAPSLAACFNVKGCYEFNAENRPKDWNLWLTLALAIPIKPLG